MTLLKAGWVKKKMAMAIEERKVTTTIKDVWYAMI